MSEISALESASGLGQDWELLLMRLRYREGRHQEMGSHRPMLLDDPREVVVIYKGTVDIFLVHIDELGVGSHEYLFSAGPGSALFGSNIATRQLGLLARGAPDNEVIRMSRERLFEMGREAAFKPIVARLLDDWVSRLQDWLSTRLPPRDCYIIEAGQGMSLSPGTMARPRHQVLWVRHRTGGSLLNSRPDLPALEMGPGYYPLAPSMWLESAGETSITSLDTPAALERSGFIGDLNAFNEHILDALTIKEQQENEAERQRLEFKAREEASRRRSAFAELAAVISPRAAQASAGIDHPNALFEACQRLGRELRIRFVAPLDLQQGRQLRDPLQEIARASRVRVREVALDGAWWTHDHGPLLAFREEDQSPVALIRTRGGYELYDPQSNQQQRLTRPLAESLSTMGFMFYRSLPDRPLTLRDLLAFGLFGSVQDVQAIAALGLLASALALLPAAATAYIFNTVIPQGFETDLYLVAALLGLGALAAASFEVVRGVTLARVEMRLEAGLQAAIIDRLLKLPVTFFRDYTAGDLGERAMAFSTIRQQVSRTAVTSLMLAVFSLVNLLVIFVFGWQLALIAVGLVALLIALVLGLSAAQLRYERRLADLRGRLSGLVFQIANSISRLRVAGAEERSFAGWAQRFAEQRRVAYRARTVGNQLAVLSSVYPVISAAVIYALVGFSRDNLNMPVGNFLAFYTAFSSFIVAGLSFVEALRSVLNVIPVYERALPILEATPEVDESKLAPGELRGSIEVAHVSFRYAATLPTVLDDVTLHIRAGEFVALVGPSGSGKSTLLRLMLGFDKPQSGAVYYDGQDLSLLDIGAVRRQIGIVQQDGKLMTGSIFHNIVGSASLDMDRAWEAAALAGLADDIKLMPMGMYTWIGEGGGNFSGGQRQRLLIARALVNKPRILFLDEATSALDNRSQALITRSLNELDTTRVVVAHRLSTIENADRIYVIVEGRIEQAGRFDELIDVKGPFKELARRQLL